VISVLVIKIVPHELRTFL